MPASEQIIFSDLITKSRKSSDYPQLGIDVRVVGQPVISIRGGLLCRGESVIDWRLRATPVNITKVVRKEWLYAAGHYWLLFSPLCLYAACI